MTVEDRGERPKPARVSRRGLLGGGVSGVAAFAAARASAASPVDPTAAAGGLRFRAFMRAGSTPKIDTVTLDRLGTHRVLVKTQACQCCYSIVTQAQPTSTLAPYPAPRILGHGGVGVVTAVGEGVRRVRPGDRVIVANTPQCGECYNCIRGRADVCQMRGFASELLPIGKLADGSPVTQHNNEGGFAEYMVPYEEYCVPITSTAPAGELSMIGCVGGCGLGVAMCLAPVHAGAYVAVFGCGPVGLSAVQAARIMGAEKIIAVEPVKERLDLALKMGATVGLDPNVEGAGLVAKIKSLTKGWTDRKYAGSRWTRDVNADNNQLGADFVFECVGGDRGTTTRPSLSPDPTGILPLKQAYEVTSEGGAYVTPSVAQQGEISFVAGRWTNSNRTHYSSQFGGVHIMRDLPRFVSLLEQGRYDAKSLVTMDVPLDRVQAAFQAVADRSTIGAVVTFP
jgi:S-(hydroxymethyl)glutathione dehydrogenase/alcohol dehydrogenase